jgi:hypothetical protein
MTPVRFGFAGITLVLASGCSEQPRKAPPTEQEIHAGDSGDASGIAGRHPYRCDDDRPLLVDFKNEGLTLELRRDGNAAPVVLTAPAAGLQYVGDTMSAMFSGTQDRGRGQAPRLVQEGYELVTNPPGTEGR